MPTFPELSEAFVRDRLEPPSGPVRVIIDTDTANEIDDQFTIAWALLSQDQLEIEGTVVEPYSFAHHRPKLLEAYEQVKGEATRDGEEVAIVGSHVEWVRNLMAAGIDPRDVEFVGPDEGMERSYHEAVKTYELLDEDPRGNVFRGSPGYLPSLDEPFDNEGVRHIIDRAMADDDRPLYIAAIGALPNLASAILIEPRIIERIVVLWTSGYPSYSPQSNVPSLNLVQDLVSSRLLFDCGVPHLYMPGFHIGAQLSISLPEMEHSIKGRGRIGDYLHHLYTHNPIHAQRGITDLEGRTWVVWDLITIAWLLEPRWVPTIMTSSPTLDGDLYWRHPDGRHPMREAVGIDRDEIYRDLFRKLESAP